MLAAFLAVSGMQFPALLTPGAPIAVVAPSGPFDEGLLRTGLARLAQFDVRIPDGLCSRQSGFFAGTAEVRREELQTALDSDVVKAILIARGGYGIGPLLPSLNWDRFARSPKWVVGFSDVTALHSHLTRHGFASIHGPNGTTLKNARKCDLDELTQLLLTAPRARHSNLTPITGGCASGPLAGGNLTVLFTEAVAGRLKLPPGAVLMLEDVTETSYRIDRMLTALLDGGHLNGVSAFVLGDFTKCDGGRFGVSTEDVLRSRLGAIGVPVLSGLRCGHGDWNRPLLFGAACFVDGDRGALLIGQPDEE